MREREEERERLLRQRRMKNRNLLKTPNKKAVIPSDGFDNFDTDEGNTPFSPTENVSSSPVGLLDKFDDQWNSIANAPGSPSNDQQLSLLNAALESDNNTANANESNADYFQNLNTEPTTAAVAEPVQVISPQQRRVNRPMRIQVPAGRGQGNVPAAVRVATPGRGVRR